MRAKTITESDLKKIKAIDKVRKEQRKQTIEGNVQMYTALLLGDGETKSIFESAAKRTDILQYMLVLTGDLIEGENIGEMDIYICKLKDIARCARIERCSYQPSTSLQALVATIEAIEQCRRSNTPTDLCGPLFTTVKGFGGTTKVYAAHRRCFAEDVLVHCCTLQCVRF